MNFSKVESCRHRRIETPRGVGTGLKPLRRVWSKLHVDSRKIFGGPEKNEHSFRAQKYFFWEFPSEADQKIDFAEI